MSIHSCGLGKGIGCTVPGNAGSRVNEKIGDDQRLQPAAFSVAQFCARNDLCRRSLYNYWEQGIGPRYFKVGARVLITAQAEADWHREREAKTAGNAAA